MRIAQVSATFPPYLAGTGNVCHNYSIELAKLGHDVNVYTSEYNASKYPANNNQAITVNYFKPLIKIGNAPLMPQLLFIKKCDLIHLHYPFFFGGEMISLLSKLRGYPFIITYHNDVILNNSLDNLMYYYDLTVSSHVINTSRKIIISTLDYSKNSKLAKIFQDNRDKLLEIPIGTDINRFNPNIQFAEIKLKWNLTDEKIILFVGALDKSHWFKGVEYLLRGFDKIVNDNYRLIIVGEGSLKEHYVDIAKKLGISKYVIFAGRVSDDELPEYYSMSDLVVLPSISVESFGLVLIEAMAAGKPVIASDLPGVRTVVSDGINGFLAKPKDVDELASKMQYLLEDEVTCKGFGVKGRKIVEKKFSWEVIGRKLEKVYFEVLSS
jgi:glycosyltransferase involved in cell wall biosynthesis